MSAAIWPLGLDLLGSAEITRRMLQLDQLLFEVADDQILPVRFRRFHFPKLVVLKCFVDE